MVQNSNKNATVVLGADRACADHLPLYRQAQIFLRQGLALDRSTLGDWIGRACWWLRPVYERVVSHIMAAEKIFTDDTGLPVLATGRGRTKTGQYAQISKSTPIY